MSTTTSVEIGIWLMTATLFLVLISLATHLKMLKERAQRDEEILTRMKKRRTLQYIRGGRND